MIIWIIYQWQSSIMELSLPEERELLEIWELWGRLTIRMTIVICWM